MPRIARQISPYIATIFKIKDRRVAPACIASTRSFSQSCVIPKYSRNLLPGQKHLAAAILFERQRPPFVAALELSQAGYAQLGIRCLHEMNAAVRSGAL